MEGLGSGEAGQGGDSGDRAVVSIRLNQLKPRISRMSTDVSPIMILCIRDIGVIRGWIDAECPFVSFVCFVGQL
jgi:hypothetical protein